MTTRRSILLQLLALALAIGMSLLAWPFLHGAVPIHWGISGQPDGYGSPALSLLLTPLLIAGLIGGTVLIARGKAAPGAGLLAAMALVAGWFVIEHGLMLSGGLFRGFSPVRPLLALVFGLLVGLGPIMARIEPNPWCGIRTPWTMGSRRVWKETHRTTARLWLIGGILGSALTMFGTPLLLVIGYLILLGTSPIVISYLVWRKLGRP